ncbi:Microtubule-nucleating Tub4p (gamma-tubulin) complex component [Naganishia albida]|nr:Microtubule-nucleating Tub4p (gamma-tubulin) complex component [Naganishia albida]
MLSVLEPRNDGYGRHQRSGSSAAASTSSHPSRSNVDTTVRDIRRPRPESNDVEADAALPRVMPRGSQESNPSVTPGDDKGKTKAEIMREWRQSQGKTPRDTDLLLRDMLYLLQGIDGKYARFAKKSRFEKQKRLNPYLVDQAFPRPGGARDDKGKGKQVDEVLADDEEIRGIDFVDPDGQPHYVSPSLQMIIVQLAELGVLYRRVFNYMQRKQDPSIQDPLNEASMTEQSLCHFLENELANYLQLLATLENEMHKDAAVMPKPKRDDEREGTPPAVSSLVVQQVPTESSRMTFQKLAIWADEYILKVRLMSSVVAEAKKSRGGALVSAIYVFTSHGDPFTRDFSNRILEEVSKPFFLSLHRWISSGVLHDPFNEFFVQVNPETAGQHFGRAALRDDMGFGYRGDVSSRNDIAYTLWEKRYIFRKEMLPTFLNEDFGKKIFSTGKSINFIRYGCRDSGWEETEAQLADVRKVLTHNDIAGLESTIDLTYKIASKRLLDIFFDQYHLMDHLQAVKRYILLSAGDFAELLHRNLSPRLDRPASKLLRHHLTTDIETAIQESNARFESPEILQRLDARLQTAKPTDSGWDCFALEYKVEAPINAVLDDKALTAYEHLFNHLWRLRRVSTKLQSNWLTHTFAIRRYKHLKEFVRAWHQCNIIQAQMVHFMSELQAFCHLEGIAVPWSEFVEFTEKRSGDLDELIAAHRSYLRAVSSKVLLRSKNREEEALFDVIETALNKIMNFADLSNQLYQLTVRESARLDNKKMVERGIIPASSGDNAEEIRQDRDTLERRLRRCGEDFKTTLQELVYGLGTHSNSEVKFLGLRLSFNDVYTMRKVKAKPAKTESKPQTAR